MTIAYVEHPVTTDEKARYRKKFDKVIDIRFAPEKLGEGDQKFIKNTEPKEGTVDWLKSKLDDAKIEYDESAKKADLEKLFDNI